LKIDLLKSFLKSITLLLVLNSLLNAFLIDTSLPRVSGIKSITDRDSVGFEWKSLSNYPNVRGINIYRALAKRGFRQSFEKIASIANRFSTHFVDTTVQPGKVYFYTFTTFAGFSESANSNIVKVKTKPPYKAVKFIEAKLVDRGVVKLLWVPHSDITIREYVIQRKCRDNRWHYLTTVKGRLYPEYVDTTAPRGYICHYRLFARDASKLNSFVSKVLSVEVK